MKFVDEVEIQIRAGHGGAGLVHFLREKFRPQGGPDGGDGGKGGDLYLEANPGIQTLGHMLKSEKYAADDGEPGRASNCTGRSAEDFTIQVPLGTEVSDVDTEQILGDLNRPGMRLLVAKGGRGGLGNQHFANSVNQAPHYAQPGEPGETKWIRLQLKLIADAGLIGLPNAGKSTLLASISRSHPKIADYAFTTLTPNLGVVENSTGRRLLLADVPGIIEGAHKGAGLGLSFLRHIERVRFMVYVIDIASLDPVAELEMLKSELTSYSPELILRPSVVVLNKLDVIQFDTDYAEEISAQLLDPSLWKESQQPPKIIYISALTGEGVSLFKETMFSMISGVTLAEQLLPGADPERDREIIQGSEVDQVKKSADGDITE